MPSDSWKKEHKSVIDDFLRYMNQHSHDYILKGGTSLRACYGLDRMSEDIDLDSMNKGRIGRIVEDFCSARHYTFRIAKRTDTVQRYMINYGKDSHPLKIEISYRRKNIDPQEYEIRKGITVYNIDRICQMKTSAYNSRDKLRDLYDIVFICNHYWNEITDTSKNGLRDAFEYKGLEQFDYLVNTTSDTSIDEDRLADDFLSTYEKLGLITESEEQIYSEPNTEDNTISKNVKQIINMLQQAESEYRKFAEEPFHEQAGLHYQQGQELEKNAFLMIKKHVDEPEFKEMLKDSIGSIMIGDKTKETIVNYLTDNDKGNRQIQKKNQHDEQAR